MWRIEKAYRERMYWDARAVVSAELGSPGAGNSVRLVDPCGADAEGYGYAYISHLLAVTAIVLEYGGDEEQAIEAMLHDAIEDQGAHQEPAIAAQFGPRVARIVRGCTDADTVPKPPWRDRKQAYLDHLAEAEPDTLLVSAADKPHNARAICADLRRHGLAVFDRFKGGRDGTLWYYSELADRFSAQMPGPLAVELAGAVSLMGGLASNMHFSSGSAAAPGP